MIDPSTPRPAGAPALTEPGTVLGTIGYMAPEQLAGAELGPAADVYALGAILFELLTVKPLHPGATVESVLASLASPERTRASSVAPDVPPELDEICARATHPDPARRYSSARALHDAIERYLDGARDEARRHELSTEHAKRAREMSKRALSDPKGAAHRSDAMREVGRALALDPENDEALRTLVELLTRPPEVAPKEVEAAIVRSEEQQLRQQGIYGAVAYGAMIAFLPVVAWTGVRDWPSVAMLFGALAAASMLALRVYRSKHPTQAQVFGVFVLSTIAFALTSHFFGPYVITPAAIAVNTTLYSINARRDVRWASIAVGALTLLVLIVIEWIRASAYAFDANAIVIHPQALSFPPLPTRLFVSLLCLASIVSGPLALSNMRETLRRAERQNELMVWQIRALVPEKARRAVPDSRR
jgi:serine/threonine-protein kinase